MLKSGDVEKMKRLLLDADNTLSQITLEMHYDSLQELSSDFKKATGMTPSKFRRMHRNQDEVQS